MTWVDLLQLFSWLLSTTMKGSILILLVAAIQFTLGPRLDARWRHLLWLVVLMRLLLPAVPPSAWSLFNLIPETGLAMPPIPAFVSPASMPPGEDAVMRITEARLAVAPWWPRWALAIWLAGVLVLALRTLIASHLTSNAVRRAMRSGSCHPELDALVAECAASIGIHRRVAIVECSAVRTPALHGFFRPAILLPHGLRDSFTRDELRNVVIHELWHLRRWDVAVSWMLAVVQTLHWFNPLVWFAAMRIREERELACDELALSCLEEDERTGYGRTILKLLERFRAAAPVPALVGIVNHKQKMKRRLSMIASFRNRTRFSFLVAALVLGVGAVGLTDAVAGPKRFMKKIDPAAAVTIEKLEERLTFEVTNASFNDFLNTVASKAGVAIVQSEQLATSDIQKARFTLKADNVPAHVVLMEALIPFELTATPGANAVTIEGGDSIERVEIGEPGEIERDVVIRRSAAGDEKTFVRKRETTTDAAPAGADRVILRKIDGDAPHSVEDRVMLRKLDKGAASRVGEDGVIRSEMKMKLSENGVTTEGTLNLEIHTK